MNALHTGLRCHVLVASRANVSVDDGEQAAKTDKVTEKEGGKGKADVSFLLFLPLTRFPLFVPIHQWNI